MAFVATDGGAELVMVWLGAGPSRPETRVKQQVVPVLVADRAHCGIWVEFPHGTIGRNPVDGKPCSRRDSTRRPRHASASARDCCAKRAA